MGYDIDTLASTHINVVNKLMQISMGEGKKYPFPSRLISLLRGLPFLGHPCRGHCLGGWALFRMKDSQRHCKGNCGRAGRGAECGAERGTSRGSKVD